MKPLLWFGIIGTLALGLIATPATARMAVESPTAKGGAATAPQARKSGVIGRVDMGAGTMEIGGVKYLFAPSMTRVLRKSGSSTPEMVNPLTLRADAQVEFLTQKEGALERITDIWLMGGKP